MSTLDEGESEIEPQPTPPPKTNEKLTFKNNQRCLACQQHNITICTVSAKPFSKLKGWATGVASQQSTTRRPTNSSCAFCASKGKSFCNFPSTAAILGDHFQQSHAGLPADQFPINRIATASRAKRPRIEPLEPVASSSKTTLPSKPKPRSFKPPAAIPNMAQTQSQDHKILRQLEMMNSHMVQHTLLLQQICQAIQDLTQQSEKDEDEE